MRRTRRRPSRGHGEFPDVAQQAPERAGARRSAHGQPLSAPRPHRRSGKPHLLGVGPAAPLLRPRPHELAAPAAGAKPLLEDSGGRSLRRPLASALAQNAIQDEHRPQVGHLVANRDVRRRIGRFRGDFCHSGPLGPQGGGLGTWVRARKSTSRAVCRKTLCRVLHWTPLRPICATVAIGRGDSPHDTSDKTPSRQSLQAAGADRACRASALLDDIHQARGTWSRTPTLSQRGGGVGELV